MIDNQSMHSNLKLNDISFEKMKINETKFRLK